LVEGRCLQANIESSHKGSPLASGHGDLLYCFGSGTFLFYTRLQVVGLKILAGVFTARVIAGLS